jgi:hypothetical protein
LPFVFTGNPVTMATWVWTQSHQGGLEGRLDNCMPLHSGESCREKCALKPPVLSEDFVDLLGLQKQTSTSKLNQFTKLV